MNPEWYGQQYPTLDNLMDFGESLGAYTQFSKHIHTAVYIPETKTFSLILIPNQHGALATIWALAHEIGHLCQHGGPKGKLFWGKDEAQANRWAACALIPRTRIEYYNNASKDAFIASLSAHYEELPLHDCPARNLAHRIASIRLETLAVKQE
ncbi:MAG: ImmA/IrrE family metallo-endopeptidase [Holophagaceae bacterium]|nr:ImmA/IrrE family metallo-endopeptidase [Holophagaceae bacterium]